jgi:hypothetical protein
VSYKSNKLVASFLVIVNALSHNLFMVTCKESKLFSLRKLFQEFRLKSKIWLRCGLNFLLSQNVTLIYSFLCLFLSEFNTEHLLNYKSSERSCSLRSSAFVFKIFAVINHMPSFLKPQKRAENKKKKVRITSVPSYEQTRRNSIQ